MEWDWSFAWAILPRLMDGAKTTVLATFLGFFLGAVIGLFIALARRSRQQWLAKSVGFGADFIRGTPLLVQLYILFFVLPSAGIVLSPLTAGIIGLGLHNSTYIAEVYRAGIESISRGQWEAARACNLSMAQTWRHIILPQAIPPMIPALSNYLIAMFKETPLLSAITVYEIMGQALAIAGKTYRYIEPITMVGAFFLIVSLGCAYLTRLLERHTRIIQ
ncbi:ectoine/hydroxyectoine ABC transporter permease subunit EhuD [Rhodoligotrophos defluvii]|uniref:ectoine/hydroxyectoine ABC transporter permease subunit EhuD n=1 Tax=Rhodoligotrophos defluvii TaxID=2561934 RepID=UPI0010CA09DC|nr:ectoine/hydroxyectoine ABC transporter permease subunit EhuD [Rhodoligotrophos defluvii]